LGLVWTRVDRTTWTAPHPRGGHYMIHRNPVTGYHLTLSARPGRPLRRYGHRETVAGAKRLAQVIETRTRRASRGRWCGLPA
jgi:hypothetical protein